jgi:maltoporin
MKMKYTLLAAAAMGMLSTTASAVDFGGYFRVGPGQKQNDGENAKCFGGLGIGGKGGIGRLGNECDTYGEFALSQPGKVGGVDYKALVMVNFYRPGSDVSDEKVGVNQLYVEGKGFDIAPNSTFWVGKRFYGRADVHFDDVFVVNMSGTGAGIDIPMGGATLGVAGFRDGDGSGSTLTGSRLNVDFSGLAVNPGGKLRVTGVLTKAKGSIAVGEGTAEGEDGAGISVQHNQSGLFGADNVFWAQWAKGSAGLNMNFGDLTADSDTSGWRLVDAIGWAKGPLSAQAMVQFGKYGIDGARAKWTSLGGRVAYAMTKNFKIQAELGTSGGKIENGDTARVTKFTVAPTLTVGPDYYDRPELRFYVSTFKFNSTYQALVGSEKKSKTAAGFQAEIWF